MTDSLIYDRLRRHGGPLLWGAYVTFISVGLVGIAVMLSFIAYMTFPWCLLLAPLVSLFYAVGRLA